MFFNMLMNLNEPNEELTEVLKDTWYKIPEEEKGSVTSVMTPLMPYVA